MPHRWLANRAPAAAVGRRGTAGNFVVVWSGGSYGGTDTSLSSILAQRYDSNGVAQGGQFQVNTYTTNEQYTRAVAADAAGNFVVVWESDGSAGTDPGDGPPSERRWEASSR